MPDPEDILTELKEAVHNALGLITFLTPDAEARGLERALKAAQRLQDEVKHIRINRL